jgi:hypothetical protein
VEKKRGNATKNPQKKKKEDMLCFGNPILRAIALLDN